jgi:hypothetical protein
VSAAERPDILVLCNHGIYKGPEEVVQRFHWRDGAWIPKDTSGENWTYPGAPESSFSPEGLANGPAGRGHLNTRCGHSYIVMGQEWICREKVPMQWSRAQIALTALWSVRSRLDHAQQESGAPLKVSLQDLRNYYDRAPRMS